MSQVVGAPALIPSTCWGQRLEDLCEFEAILVYRVSSRTSQTLLKMLYLEKKVFYS